MDEARRGDAGGVAPDLSEVNEAWPALLPPLGGWRGRLARLLAGWLAPQFEAQRRFNAAQVRLDNALARSVDERCAALERARAALGTDLVRRLDDVDERHRLLERELVRHVRDLVTRIDVVLSDSNRDRQALRSGLEDVRARLASLEQALGREA